jgi:hypothetical protein
MKPLSARWCTGELDDAGEANDSDADQAQTTASN